VDTEQNKKLDDLTEDVRSLKFDNERIVKPALKDIRDILSRDVYAPKTDVAELKTQIEELQKALAEHERKAQNYPLVEKIVFGMVGLILVAVVGALIALVVTAKGN
jgi:tetrahydromethanopterin S-methyltransferase subunit B